jgi:hypothetical protein
MNSGLEKESLSSDLAKVQEEGWDQKYARAQKAAEDGVVLFRDLDRVVKKLNRHRAAE